MENPDTVITIIKSDIYDIVDIMLKKHGKELTAYDKAQIELMLKILVIG